MKYMYQLFYQYDHSVFMKKFTERTSFDSVVWLDLSIRPIDQPETYKLYYIPTNKIIHLVTEIYKVTEALHASYHQLPQVAQDQFILENIIDELYHTNDLEGVHSSKAEIAKSVKNVQLKKKDKKRFDSMIKSYMSLMTRKIALPTTVEDVRGIYDKITDSEIAKDDLPDGEIFRKEPVYVLAKSGSGKVIHRGLVPEEEIIKAVERLLSFLNGAEHVPIIIKVAIGHYYFGYIHPFYDGNGRTSRFISSLYLAEALGEVPALSLSKAANRRINKYLEAFDRTNRMVNRGEMNFFIDSFLEIILDTLSEMNKELKEKIALLNLVSEKLASDSQLPNTNYLDMMFILAQHYFFEYSEGVTVKEIAKALHLSDTTVRNIAKQLLAKSYIKQKGIRPAYYSLHEAYLEMS